MPDSRDIFRLLQEGRLDDALATARQVYATTPQDTWTLGAYAKALNENLKAARESDDVARMRTLYNEFAPMHLPDEETVWIEVRERWRGAIPAADGVPSLVTLLQQSKTASEGGNRQKALLGEMGRNGDTH